MSIQTSVTIVDDEVRVSVTSFFETDEEIQEAALKAFVRSPYSCMGKYYIYLCWPSKHDMVYAAWNIVKPTGKFSRKMLWSMNRQEICDFVELIRKTS
jgi:hypothetical protein